MYTGESYVGYAGVDTGFHTKICSAAQVLSFLAGTAAMAQSRIKV